MGRILLERVEKTFVVAERDPGVLGAVRGLVRRRRRVVHALADMSFAVEPGELVGLVGPNGAGKSTTVKILSGILVPSAGRVEVDGRVPWKERARHVASIGVVFGQRTQLWWDLPVADSFDLLRDIYRVPPAQFAATRDELVAMLDLAPLLDVPVRQLSLGQRMRCDLAAALLHRPRILFLDEPTIGLDAVAKLAVRKFVRALCDERGVTIVLTTHDMDDIEALCRRILVIAGGRLLVDGTLDDLRRRIRGERRVIVDFADDATVDELDVEGARLVERRGQRLVFAVDPATRPVPAFLAEIAARRPVRDLFVENPPIEEIVAELYRSTCDAP